MRVWRLTRLPYADLSGAGAERLGGRWTSPRIPVVYAATDAALAAYKDARIDGLKSALAILALITVLALFAARRIPTVPVGSTGPPVQA